MKRLISIVTPCYNEEANVRLHFERVCRAIEPFREKYEFEHIYTDNCSQDRTFALLQELGAAHANVRAMRFARNIGANRAIYLGLMEAKGDAAVLIQADLQDPPELIPEFIKGWEEGNDVVFGQIQGRRENFVLRGLRSVYYRIIAALSEFPIPRNAGEFRLVSRRVLTAISKYNEDDPYLRGVVAHIGFQQKAVPYLRAERAGGRTSTSLIGLFSYALNGLISTTAAPIRAVVLTGFAIAALGVVLMIVFVAGRLIFPGEPPHGFTSLALLITFFSGVQLFAIGIIGEYIRKIFSESLGRPKGFIKDTVNFR